MQILRKLASRLARSELLTEDPFLYALVARTNEGVFAVAPDDGGVGKTLLRSGSYNEAELRRLSQYITAQSKVLVVGAHVGALAIPLANRCRELCAVEANPTSFQLLQCNVRLNAASNCKLFNCAANDKAESLEFLLSRANSGGSKRVPKNKERMYYYDNPATIRVPGLPLDECISEREFDLIVMDIEGSEYPALKGMPRILTSVRTLAIEFLPHHLRNVTGISPADFLSALPGHFVKLTIPSKGITVGRSDFLRVLMEMYERDEGDDGVIFTKASSLA